MYVFNIYLLIYAQDWELPGAGKGHVQLFAFRCCDKPLWIKATRRERVYSIYIPMSPSLAHRKQLKEGIEVETTTSSLVRDPISKNKIQRWRIAPELDQELPQKCTHTWTCLHSWKIFKNCNLLFYTQNGLKLMTYGPQTYVTSVHLNFITPNSVSNENVMRTKIIMNVPTINIINHKSRGITHW